MKNFNCICMITLLTCGTYCVSNLHAETPEITENQNEAVDFELSTDAAEQIIQDHEAELSSIQSTFNPAYETKDIHISVDENISDDTQEISIEISIPNQISNDIAQIQVIIAQEETNLEDDLDTMVEELVQSGAVEDDISGLENQPKWKLLLARVGSYALSMGITCKQLIMDVYTNMRTTVGNYWSNKKNA